MNEEWVGNRQEIPAQVRLHMELLAMALEDVEVLTYHVQNERLESDSIGYLEQLIDAMNKARYYLYQLGADF